MFESFLKPSITTRTITGDVCTFTSQGVLPLVSHKIALTATQSGSGTPSPDNVRTINGYSAIGVSATGLNLWGGNALLRSFINANISGFSYDTTLKTLSYGAPQIGGKVMPLYGLKANTQYTFILTATNTNHTGHVNLQILYSDDSSTLISAGSVDLQNNKTTFAVTSTANKTIVAVRGANYNGTATLYYDECCLLEGVHTVDDFEPFGTFKNIDLGGTYYGGEYDARTGLFTVTHEIVDLGTLDWANVTTTGIARTSSVSYMKYLGDLICTQYKAVKSNDLNDLEIAVTNSQALPLLRVRNVADFTGKTAAQVKTLLSGVMLVYELATPTTIQLAPCPIDTLEGVNNIWADTGDTTLSYITIG